jgi:hypothetical protein
VDTSALDADAAFLGIDLALLDPVKKSAPEDLEVWVENEDALEVFLAMATQWRYAPLGGIVGMDYPSLNSVMDMLCIEGRKDMFFFIRLMESAALEVINAESKVKNGG